MKFVNLYDNGIYFKVDYDTVRNTELNIDKNKVKEYNRDLWFSSYLFAWENRECELMTSLKIILSFIGLSTQSYSINLIRAMLKKFIDKNDIEIADIFKRPIVVDDLELNMSFIIKTTKQFHTDRQFAKNYKRITKYEFDKCNYICSQNKIDVVSVWRLYLLIRCSMISNGKTIEEEFKDSRTNFYTISAMNNITTFDIKTIKAYLKALNDGELLYTYTPSNDDIRLPYTKNYYFLDNRHIKHNSDGLNLDAQYDSQNNAEKPKRTYVDPDESGKINGIEVTGMEKCMPGYKEIEKQIKRPARKGLDEVLNAAITQCLEEDFDEIGDDI